MEHASRFRSSRGSNLVRSLALLVTAWVLALAPARAARPTLVTPASPLSGGVEDTAFTITYSTLTNATQAMDADGDAVSLRVESITSGTLTESGTNVVTGSTLLSAGESWVWTPALNDNGSAVAAFTVRAFAGGETSAGAAVQVSVAVSARNDAPTLSQVDTLTGATEDTSFNISYATLAAAADEMDVDGDTLSFRAISVTTGTLTKNGATAVGTTLAGGETYVWTPAQNQNGTLNAFVVGVTDGTANSAGSVQVTVEVDPVNDAPTITGTLAGGKSVPIPDNRATNLFAGLTVADIDSSSVTVTVELVGGDDERGTFAGTSNPRSFSVTGSPSAVTAALRANVFNPTPDLAPSGDVSPFELTLELKDSANLNSASPLQGTNLVYVESINDAPTLSVSINPGTITDGQDVTPFSLSIVDPEVDPNETYSLTVTVVNISPVSNSSVVFGTLNPPGPFTGTKSAVESAIAGLLFSPVRDSVDSSQIVEFRFSLTDQGGAGATGTASAQLTITGENDPPDILGVATTLLRITDDVIDFRPFSAVRIEDIDGAGAQIMKAVTISVSDPSKGVFVPPGPFTNMTPAQVTDVIRTVVFLPDGARIPEGQTETVSMTIRVEDIQGAVRSDNRTVVAITSVNGAPRINNVPPPADQPVLIPPLLVTTPFTGIVIEDDNTNLTVTVRIDNPAKGALISSDGFMETGEDTGVYRVQGTPAEVTTALVNLGFQVNPTFSFPPNEPGGTTFTITAADNALNSTTKTLSILLQYEPRNLLVTRLEDDLVEGSLRHAVANAGNNDFITFALPSYPALIRLQVTNGPVVLSRNVVFRGPGANLLTLSGDSDGNLIPDTRLFDINAAVVMEGMTLTRGLGRETPEGPITGGAIYVGPRGRLVMSYCVITDSRAAQWGGAIDVNQGSLLMKNCLVRGNRVDDAIGMGGGAVSIYTDLPCAFLNITFSGNVQGSATGVGGGALYVENFNPATELLVEVNHGTFTENADAADLGSSIAANVFGTTVAVRNSIFADGRARNLEVQGAGRIVSRGGNLSDDSTATVLLQGGQPRATVLLDRLTDDTEVDPLLGGFDPGLLPVPGHPLLAGSPANGFATVGYEAVDQIGMIRDGNPDSGALEYQAMQRLVINEIQYNPAPGGPQYLELYVLRDSLAVNLTDYTVWVDGIHKHQFVSGTVLQPGRGLILAEATFTPEAPTNAPATPVVVAGNGPLRLANRGLVELRHRSNGSNVLAAAYNGIFVDPEDASTNLVFTTNSLTLAPQFSGFAYLPHSIVRPGPLEGANLDQGGAPSSPGRDTANTPFGVANAFPIASDDAFLVGEDTPLVARVLANDLDADGLDELVVINLSTNNEFTTTSVSLTSLQQARVTIDVGTSPLPGGAIIYDPRFSTNILQALPEGARRTESVHYEVIDFGTGPILAFEGASGDDFVTVVSPGHRLATNEMIVIIGSGVASYNDIFAVTPVAGDEDRFTIPAAFDGLPATRGSWMTVNPRAPSEPASARMTVTVLGANDPPAPVLDTIVSDEETILRILGDGALIGTGTTFASDATFAVPPVIASLSLLNNDDDPDTDDNGASLHVVGVLSEVQAIQNYSGAPGVGPVTVTSPGHGLESGEEILISGYGGHPSYTGFHAVEVVDTDSFRIPVLYVDNAGPKGVWAILNDENRASAVSEFGAEVALEIRAERSETSVTYNPRTSSYLNGIALGTSGFDTFYYAVQDRHGAVSLAPVQIQIDGVNDDPFLADDPDTLAQLNGLVDTDTSLADVLAQLRISYYIPASPAVPGRLNSRVEFDDNGAVNGFLLRDLWFTDEDTPLDILTSFLLDNDRDDDTNDVLSVLSVAPLSREGAALSLAGGMISYDPRPSESLNSLAREEPLLDSFEITVTDGQGGEVTSLVAILVLGRNDTPVARDDDVVTAEDAVLVFNPILFPGTNALLQDFEADINGAVPDNELVVLDAPLQETAVPGAFFRIVTNTVLYDPTGSDEFDALGQGEIYPTPDTFRYTIRDNSLLFANDDLFKVAADGAGYELNVLANDRNFNKSDGAMQIMAVGTPDQLGTVTVHASGRLLYTPEVNFVGDEVFTYTVTDGEGHVDQGLVTVRVTVNPLNGNLQANADRFSVAKGESPLLDVLANDNIVGAGPEGLSITRIVDEPDAGGTAVVEDGAIRFTPDAAYAGAYPYSNTFSYEISGGFTARAVAVVRVLVVNREGSLTIRDDAFSVLPGSSDNLLDVLANDSILPGDPAGLRILGFNDPTHGVVTTNATADRLLYEPDAGFVGRDSFLYTVSDGVGGTGTGRVSVSVGRLTAGDDFFVVATNEVAVLDVLANDAVLQIAPGMVTISNVNPTSTIFGTFHVGDGMTNLVFTPTNAVTGEVNLTYTITDGTGGTATGRVTVVAVGEGLNANPDFFSVLLDSSGNELDVLSNDAAIPDAGRDLTLVSIGTGLDAPNRGGTVTVNENNTRLLYSPAPGFVGEETFTYTMTDSRGTDSAKVVVSVSDGDLLANDDAYTVFYEVPLSASPALTTADILDLPGWAAELNDAGHPISPYLLAQLSPATLDLLANYGGAAVDPALAAGLVEDINALIAGVSLYDEADFSEVPLSIVTRSFLDQAAEPLFVRRLNYRLLLDAYPGALARPEPMSFTLSVLDNDRVLPDFGQLLFITGVGIDTDSSSNAPNQSGTVEIVGEGLSLIYTPRDEFGMFPYPETFTYEISDGSSRRAEATVTVQVVHRTNARDLDTNDDSFTVGGDSQNNRLNVLANDNIKPAGAGAWTITSVSAPTHDLVDASDLTGVAVISGPLIQYTPPPGFVGTETFIYTVSDGLGGTGLGLVTVKVGDLPLCPDTFTAMSEGPVQTLDVLNNDGVFPRILEEFVLLDAGPASHNGAVVVTDGLIQYTPDGNYGGAYPYVETFAYRVRDDSLMTVSALASVTVYASGSDRSTANVNVHVAGVNDTPLISGTVAGQTVYERSSLRPFASIKITEIDRRGLEPVWVRVRVDNPSQGYLTALGPFTDAGGGLYELGSAGNGVTAAMATQALRELAFAPTTDGRVSPGSPETTRLTVEVEDGLAPTVVDDTTTVVALDALVDHVLTRNGNSGDELGLAVANLRDWMAVGAPFTIAGSGSMTGGVLVFKRRTDGSDAWDMVQQLAPAGLLEGDQFGWSLAMSAGTLVVGARFDGANNRESGAAHVYTRSGDDAAPWIFQQKIFPADGAGNDQFGNAVDVSGDLIAVGANRDDDQGDASGAAYVFRHVASANQWVQVDKLLPGNGSLDDLFGQAVGIDGDEIIVGAPFANPDRGPRIGGAYLFRANPGDSNQWTEVKFLMPSDGAEGDQFGHTVDLADGRAAIGAPFHGNAVKAGAVYVHARDQDGLNQWGLDAKIVPPGAAAGDEIGKAVALDGEVMLIGASRDDNDGVTSGAAYVYASNRNGTGTWGLVEKLAPPSGDAYNRFGFAVSLRDDTAVVGARFDNGTGERFASAYAFRLKYNNPPAPSMAIPSVVVATNEPVNFTLPVGLFADPDLVQGLLLLGGITDAFELSAALEDGSELPAWLSFDAATGVFSGLSENAAEYVIRVTAGDEEGAMRSASFLLSVLEISGGGTNSNPAPSIVLSMAYDPAGGELVMSYVRPLNASNADYELLRTENFSGWVSAQSAITSQAVVPVDAATERVTVRISTAGFASGAQFFRMQITL